MSVIPVAKAVKDLLEDLLGRGVVVTPSDPLRAPTLRGTAMAVYVDDRQRLAAVAGMDLPLAANVAAAIGLVPAGGAKACVEDKELSPMLAENFTEVCNVLSTLLNSVGAAHVSLHRVFLPGQAPPTDVSGRLLALGNRLDLDVEVAGYGSGRFALSLV